LETKRKRMIIEPNHTLTFKRPFSTDVKETLKITNDEDSPMAFKVKTTSPKHYSVRPNSGIIQKGQTTDVIVTLQLMKDKDREQPDYVCKDKFLIQCVKSPENVDLSSLWAESEQPEKKGQIQEFKLKCQYIDSGNSAESTFHLKSDSPTSSLHSLDTATEKSFERSISAEKAVETAAEKPVEKPVERVTEKPVEKSIEKHERPSEKPAVTVLGETTTKQLEMLLQEASDKNKQLIQENAQLKRQVEMQKRSASGAPTSGSSLSPAASAALKVKAPHDVKWLVIIAIISFVLGFQLASLF